MRVKRCISVAAISVFLGSCMIFSSSATPAFSDVDIDASYSEAVSYVSEAGIMVGDENGNFNPDKTVTRAEMAVILCNMLGETENLTTDGSVFADVPANHWANSYVVKASKLGIVSGYGNGIFGVSDNITFEQALTMVINALGMKDEAVNLGGYPDGYFAVANKHGYTNNITVGERDSLSRGNTAILLYNVAV